MACPSITLSRGALDKEYFWIPLLDPILCKEIDQALLKRSSCYPALAAVIGCRVKEGWPNPDYKSHRRSFLACWRIWNMWIRAVVKGLQGSFEFLNERRRKGKFLSSPFCVGRLHAEARERVDVSCGDILFLGSLGWHRAELCARLLSRALHPYLCGHHH